MNYGISNAVLGGIEKGIEFRRAAQQLALNKAKTEQAIAVSESNRVITEERHKADMEKLNLQIDKMKNEKTKSDIYGAWDAKSVVKLNDIIDTNEKARTLFGYQNIDFYPVKPTDEIETMRNQKGIKSENAYLGDKVMPDGTVKRQVFDMNKLKIASGYSTYKKAQDLKIKAQDAKTQETLAHIKSLSSSADNYKADAAIKNKRIELASIALKNGSSPREVENILSGRATTLSTEQRQINTFKRNNPNATNEEIKAYANKILNKASNGVISNRKKEETIGLTNNQTEAINMVDNFDPKKYDRKKAIQIESFILQNLDTNTKRSIKDDINTMKANQKMVMSVNRILKEAEQGPVKVDKGVIANANTYMDTIFGKNTPQALKNVDFNTASGLLLAGFMKDISGTAVGVAEANRLTRIFQGGDLADETFVKAAMRKFAKESIEANKILKDNNKQYIPDTVIKVTDYSLDDEKTNTNNIDKTAESNTPIPQAINHQTGEIIEYRDGKWSTIQ